MNSNMLKEINYLSHLIEQYKKNQPSQVWHNQQTIFNHTLGTLQSGKISHPTKVPLSSLESNNEQKQVSSDVKYNTMSTKVHVNPNFKPQNPVIHINPRVRAKPMIHVNPQVMKNICDRKESPSTVDTKRDEITTANQNRTLTSSKVSVHVNPKLMMKLSSTAEKKPISNTQKTLPETTVPYCSRLKFVKGGSTKSTPKSALNSSIVILSKRKLVRVKRVSKPLNTSPVGVSKFKTPLNTRFKKVKVSPTKVTKPVIANTMKQSPSTNSPVKLQFVKSNVNKYTSNKTASRTFKTTQNITTATKRTINKKLEMVTIGGIVYKSSKNQLVRRSYGSKKKRVSSSKADKFIIATNGRKLHRIKTGKESRCNNANAPASTINGKPLLNTLQKPNYKTNISNRVKQRSIQILRNKMRKNNQPCLIFQRFGYCANNEKGTCPKLHDKKQVSLCKKFLQGNCLLDKCPLSHDVGPEKMPTCKYFLEGCCVRDACPYRHVKVSSSTPICIEFLQGYCAKGHECTRRHEHLCPEFEKAGKCSKGKYCTYPHKLHLTTAKDDDKRVKRKHEVEKLEYTAAVEDSSSSNNENRLRYYEQTETFLKDIEQKRENVLKQMKIMKRVHGKPDCDHSDIKERSDDEKISKNTNTNQVESKLNIQSDTQLPRRPPIGVLPAYIPIN